MNGPFIVYCTLPFNNYYIHKTKRIINHIPLQIAAAGIVSKAREQLHYSA